MYQLEFLPVARHDLIAIAAYIGQELCNPIAAQELVDSFAEAVDGLCAFPYKCPVFMPIRPLSREYRKLAVKNYFVFYRVDDEKQKITVARVVYARRRYEKLL